MSYYNPTALPERTSSNVYAADIFNCSRQGWHYARAHADALLPMAVAPRGFVGRAGWHSGRREKTERPSRHPAPHRAKRFLPSDDQLPWRAIGLHYEDREYQSGKSALQSDRQ